ncbi:MAG: restriction endonuclease, partial [Deltaproteobacteria bacterium]|nr:restriction endonuclease [Deltaproteobacteria bacterium]
MTKMINDIANHISDAVSHYWQTRKAQREKQKKRDGFIRLFTEIIVGAGMDEGYVYRKKRLELPGFFRPTKEWDLVVVKKGHLVAAIEAKSQVGPSFGNNFNNRTEEAMGSALDLWTAFREGAFNSGVQP